MESSGRAHQALLSPVTGDRYSRRVRIDFDKMQGLGNDFVVLDNLARRIPLDTDLAQRLADRRRGIGCDQLLVAEPADDDRADVRMRIFNTDGSEAGQCGNGLRCFTLYARARGLGNDGQLRVATVGGIVQAHIAADGTVSVDMGVPCFEPAEVPLDETRVDRLEHARYLAVVAGNRIEFGAVSIGNPHAVLAVDSVANAPVTTLGSAVQESGVFPLGVNVGFSQQLGNDHISLRVFERGVGETLACGTGACAAVACGRVQGRLGEQVAVDLPGGRLHVAWRGAGESLWMSGPASHVFEGHIEL